MFKEYEVLLFALIFFIIAIVSYIISKKSENKGHHDSQGIRDLDTKTKTLQSIHLPEIQPKEKSVTEDKPKKKKIITPNKNITKDSFKDFSGIKLLVAEDNVINQKVISALLADSGILLSMANDGQEALDILHEENDFLLILMDANMPVMDGYEASRKIISNDNLKHIPIVALSGDVAEYDIKRMHEAGMQEHLSKPLRLDALYNIIYTHEQNKEEKQKEQNVLNTEIGLNICGGDEEFYKEILNEFLQDYADSADTISYFLQHKQYQKANAILLDIIGVSANIGALELNKIAKELKSTLKESTQELYTQSLLQDYSYKFKALLHAISEYNSI